MIELGGRDMRRRSRMLDKEGKEVPGVYGYKYFGAARDLPGNKCLAISLFLDPSAQSAKVRLTEKKLMQFKIHF